MKDSVWNSSSDVLAEDGPSTMRDSAGGRFWSPVAWALLAAVLAASWMQGQTADARQMRTLGVLVVMAVLVPLTIRFSMAGPWKLLRNAPALLIPIPYYAAAAWLLPYLATPPGPLAWMSSGTTLQLVGISLELTALFALQVALGVAYAVWQTALVWQVVRHGQVTRIAPGPAWQQWMVRGFGVLACGWVGLFAGMAMVLMLSPALGVWALPLIGLLAIWWNFRTLAWLPLALHDSAPLPQVLGKGWRLGRTLRSRWLVPVVLQLLLLGLAIYVSARFVVAEPPPGGVPTGRTQTTVKHNTGYHVNGFWVGGYEHRCRWLTTYAAKLEVPPLPFASESLAMLFLVLAVAVKLQVAAAIVSDSAFRTQTADAGKSGHSASESW